MRLFDDAIDQFLAAIEASVNMEDAYYNLAICYARVGEYNTSWAYAYKLSQLPGMKRADGAMPKQVYQLLYPLAYRETILKNSEANKLDPFLVSAVIHQESKYAYNACSRVGALGLMQIMPLTGDEIADRLGIPDYNTDMLCSAEINIKMGTWYLSNLISKFNQLVKSTLKKQSGLEPDYYEIAKILALGAYNGGEGRVRRWMENYGIDNIDEFVENAINLRETKDYVKKVCDAYEAYKSLYGVKSDVRS